MSSSAVASLVDLPAHWTVAHFPDYAVIEARTQDGLVLGRIAVDEQLRQHTLGDEPVSIRGYATLPKGRNWRTALYNSAVETLALFVEPNEELLMLIKAFNSPALQGNDLLLRRARTSMRLGLFATALRELTYTSVDLRAISSELWDLSRRGFSKSPTRGDVCAAHHELKLLLIQECSRADLLAYSVVGLALKDAQMNRVSDAIRRLQVDADKLRMHDTELNHLLEIAS